MKVKWYYECPVCKEPVFYLPTKPKAGDVIKASDIRLADGTAPFKDGDLFAPVCGHCGVRLYVLNVDYIKPVA